MIKEKTGIKDENYSDSTKKTVQKDLNTILATGLPAKIKLRNTERTFYMTVDDMEAIKIDGHYCTFYISKDTVFKCTHTLKVLKEVLPDYFAYIDKNKIINTRKVQSICHTKPHIIMMHSGLELTSSIKKIAEIEQLVDENNHIIL
jgi:DNA-binding LytR/AlgR family response regulator